jgi:hypothetical protein
MVTVDADLDRAFAGADAARARPPTAVAARTPVAMRWVMVFMIEFLIREVEDGSFGEP